MAGRPLLRFRGLAALGTGNAIQAGNIVGSIHTAVLTFQPDFAGEQTLNLVLGIVLAVLAAIVLFGGVKRLGAVTEKLVPFMAVVYILACLAVIVYNADALPKVFHDIFVGAFTPNGVTGGAVGSVFLVISWGMKRGIFSNEARPGYRTHGPCTTSEPEPVKQALYGIFEVFMDTIVICSLTGLTLPLLRHQPELRNHGGDCPGLGSPGNPLHPEGRCPGDCSGPGPFRLLYHSGVGAVWLPVL